MTRITRREFLETAAMAAVATSMQAQLPRATADLWGSRVLDCHFHMREPLAANIAHLDGAGISEALLLMSLKRNSIEDVKALQAKYPGRFPGFAASVDVTKSDAEKLLTNAVKNGAVAFGEIKYHVEADGPEMRRIYALAAELDVPILIHFQDFPDTEKFNTGFSHFDTILKAFPKTRFVGHANSFWANISADYANRETYPTGPIVRGGVTDRWLSDYPNLFGDLSANSGHNALTRDPSFTADFLKRHADKLIFGSDCICTDGKGGIPPGRGQFEALPGKCIARETLTVLKQSTSPEIFHKLTWKNGHRVYGLKA